MNSNALTAAHTAATLGLAPLPADIKHAAEQKQQVAQRRDEAHQAGQTAQVDYERALADGDTAAAATAPLSSATGSAAASFASPFASLSSSPAS